MSEAQVINDQLSNALNSRVIIEQAKGIVAERMGINMDESFGMLRTYAATTTNASPMSPIT